MYDIQDFLGMDWGLLLANVVSSGIIICALVVGVVLAKHFRQKDDKSWKGHCQHLPSAPTDRNWRIAVVGVMASGKSSVSKELAHMLELTPVDLDKIYWKEGLQVDALAVLHAIRKELKAAVGPKRDGGWVCEGNYKCARTQVWDKADVIVYLDPSPVLRIRRLLQREFLIWWYGIPNNIGHITSVKRLSFWVGLFKSVGHASGLDFQQDHLRQNLAKFHQDLDEKHRQYVKDQEEFLAAGVLVEGESRALSVHIEVLKGEAQRAKEAGEVDTVAKCFRDIKDLTSTLRKAQAGLKQPKVVPASVPVLHLQNEADIQTFKRQIF